MPESNSFKSSSITELKTNIQFAKGVGPKTALILAKLDIHTINDFLYCFPRRHEDRTRFARIKELRHGDFSTVLGEIIAVDNVQTRGRLVITKVIIDDESGSLTLTWFGQKFRKEQFLKLRGKQIVVYGQAQGGRWGYEIASPDWEIYTPKEDPLSSGRVVPIYPLTEGLYQPYMRKIAYTVIDNYMHLVHEILPEETLDKLDLMDITNAIKNMHFPESITALAAARKRLVFDELYLLQLALMIRKKQFEKPGAGISFTIQENFEEELKQMLPFELTNAQRRVIKEILSDMKKPSVMNRLLQGDVGSGKTVVAVAAMLVAVRNGFQAALMAPTEILAEQHYIGICRMFESLGILGVSIDLLTGSLRAKQKREVLERVQSGQTQIVIGTHALMQEHVEFHKLGLVIIDEQHRFGVMQRAALMEKGNNPDILVMTATPIPRTLTLTVYGDLDISIIDEMPPGRKPVKTHWKRIGDRERVYEGVRKLLSQGSQAYVVCPLIEESEKLQVKAASELAEYLTSRIFPEYKVGLLHGQMPMDEKNKVMGAFRSGDLNLLVSTTVIEVGVDVRNASCMVIEDADRFGLAQLHQLRGRVGRGSEQAYCILICEGTSLDSIKRMEAMSSTNNGFEIAEEDLKLRGPGEFYGTKQSGLPSLKIADILNDIPILDIARKEAAITIENDPDLRNPEHNELRKTLLDKFDSFELAVIS